MRTATLMAAWLAAVFATAPASARIIRLEITGTEPAAFPGAVPYELLTGVAHGVADPADPQDAMIQDLALAPRDAQGLVPYTMDVAILKPVDPAQGNRVLLYDVVNRGRKLAAGIFETGDGFLERHGFTIVWSGWQADLPERAGLLRLDAPVAHAADGTPLTGKVRKEWELFQPTATLGLGDTDLGHGIAYPAVDTEAPAATLTRRVRQADAPIAVPRADFAFADCAGTPFPGVPDPTRICLKGGFDTDHVYELIYTARDPRVLGLGFAATRDLVAFLRTARADEAGTPNPLAGGIDDAIAHGTSQSGRFLRSFLDLGFNADHGKRVFDAMSVHIASARLALNQRFAQPGAASMQHEEHLAPVTDAPFGWAVGRDPATGREGGILHACQANGTCPEIVQAVSSIEYWNSRMSFDTTDGAGHDLPIPANVHIYHFTGTQHVLGLNAAPCRYAQNPNPYTEAMRALLLRLVSLLADGTALPPSRYPRIAEGSLVPPEKLGFPHIRGMTYTALVNNPPILDRGRDFDPARESGILGEPPRAEGSSPYAVWVPAVDADGNESDGVRSVMLAAPLGTYTGWNLRRTGFAEGELCYLVGSFFPFAPTRAAREAAGDPRPSLVERYGDHAGYVTAVRQAAGKLAADGFLLPEDAARLISAAEASSVLR